MFFFNLWKVYYLPYTNKYDLIYLPYVNDDPVGGEEVKVFGDYLESPVSDGTIEDNFEEELAEAPFVAESDSLPTTPLQDEEDFSDIAKHNIVEVVGDDAYGRKIIVLASCKLPSNKGFDHQRFLR
jgi:hypothetical protein